MIIEGSSKPWCGKYDHAIDYELVKVKKPECIEKHNGCSNCPEQYQKKQFDINYERCLEQGKRYMQTGDVNEFRKRRTNELGQTISHS